jgi:hypothetical protein
MSSVRNEIGSVALAAATEVAWRQWAALGAAISGRGGEPVSVIDPEALLLLSCAVRGSERRLDDVLSWWASAGSTLLSVQRVRTLARSYPASAMSGVTAFAQAALQHGDGRWRALAARDGSADALAARGKRSREPRLASYPALMLRLRAAFGVGVKADVLAVLITESGSDASVRRLVHATGYTPAAIRRAADEMEAARVVRATAQRPISYRVDVDAWTGLLGSPSPMSGWRFFAHLLSFLAATIEWAVAPGSDDGYVAASTARDVFEAHRLAFDLNAIAVPYPADTPGESYLGAFRATIEMLASWLASNA